MIRAQGLVKAFGEKRAVDGVSFEIPRGQVVGVLGPNGAGKTTTMRLLTAFLPADAGTAEVAGVDVARDPIEARRRLGYLPENNPLNEDWEVSDTLLFAARLRGLPPAEAGRRLRETAAACGLSSVVGQRVAELSKGYRQRLGLAQAILHDPDVLILDEPTSGLDPNQVQEVRGLIRSLRREKTVLLSTHILSEVQAVCDRVIIVHGGRVVADGRPDEVSAAAETRRRLFVELRAPAAEAQEALGRLGAVAASGSGFTVESDEDVRERLFALAVERRWPILELRAERLSLEDVFRRLTNA